MFGIKLINDLLPTMHNIKQRLNNNQAHIYSDFNCAGCDKVMETTAHLTICPAYAHEWQQIRHILLEWITNFLNKNDTKGDVRLIIKAILMDEKTDPTLTEFGRFSWLRGL